MIESIVLKAIVEKVGDLFVDKTKIPDAYDLQNNVSGLLENGWGITIGPQANTPMEFCSKTVTRDISIVFTREFIATESDDEQPIEVGLLLVDDVCAVQNLIGAPDRMNIDGLDMAEPAGASEVSTVVSGNRKFFTMQANFQITTSEKY